MSQKEYFEYIQEQKQFYLEKFALFIQKHYIEMFEYYTVEEILIDDRIDYHIERYFFRFVGEIKMPLEIFEKLDKQKFIMLALSYYYASLEN